jgi:CDGSH iron-sulfur domain-containing protein 3
MDLDKKTKITVIEGGPLIVEGFFGIKSIDGNYLTTMEKTYLCRCGKSGNKPFCDGSHKNK